MHIFETQSGSVQVEQVPGFQVFLIVYIVSFFPYNIFVLFVKEQ